MFELLCMNMSCRYCIDDNCMSPVIDGLVPYTVLTDDEWNRSCDKCKGYEKIKTRIFKGLM